MNTIKTSFSGQALAWGGTSTFLNPANHDDQGNFPTYVGKPVRAMARLAFAVGVSIIVAPTGAVYHLGMSIKYSLESLCSRNQDAVKRAQFKASQHFTASLNDFIGPISLLGIGILFKLTNEPARHSYLISLVALTFFQFVEDPNKAVCNAQNHHEFEGSDFIISESTLYEAGFKIQKEKKLDYFPSLKDEDVLKKAIILHNPTLFSGFLQGGQAFFATRLPEAKNLLWPTSPA